MIHAQNSLTTLMGQTTLSSASASSSLDTLGADYAVIRVIVGPKLNTNAVTTCTIALTESDDATTYTTMVADVTKTVGTAARIQEYHVDLKTRKRYLKVVTTPGTSTNDTLVITTIGTTGRLATGPSAASALVASTNDNVTFVG